MPEKLKPMKDKTYRVEIYDFVLKRYRTVKLSQPWHGKSVAENLTHDEARLIKNLAGYMSNGSVKLRIKKKLPQRNSP